MQPGGTAMKTITENDQAMRVWLILSIFGALLAIVTWIRLFWP